MKFKIIVLSLVLLFANYGNLCGEDFSTERDSLSYYNKNFQSSLKIKEKERGIMWEPYKKVKDFNQFLAIAVGVTIYFFVGNYLSDKLNAN